MQSKSPVLLFHKQDGPIPKGWQHPIAVTGKHGLTIERADFWVNIQEERQRIWREHRAALGLPPIPTELASHIKGVDNETAAIQHLLEKGFEPVIIAAPKPDYELWNKMVRYWKRRADVWCGRVLPLEGYAAHIMKSYEHLGDYRDAIEELYREPGPQGEA